MIANMQAEQDLLGAILINNKALLKVSSFLLTEHFSEAAHARIYELILQQSDKGVVADPITLNTYLSADPLFEEVGGASKYLAGIAANATTVFNAGQYGKIIFECWQKRQLVDIAEAMQEAALSDAQPVDQIDEALSNLFELSGRDAGHVVDMATALNSAMQQIDDERSGKITKVTTGIKDVDYAIGGGMRAPHLIILAGRPGMGKTGLALTIANNAVKAGAPGLFFSLEMGAEELMQRVLSAETGIDGRKLESGDVSDYEIEKLVEAQARISSRKLFTDDTPALNIEQIVSRARAFKERHDIKFIIVDHIQRMSDPHGMQRANRTQSLGKTIQGLKNLAKTLQVPVIALSQLNRGVEERQNKRPMLSDLRESGEIEQEADIVAFLYREEYYLERELRECEDAGDKTRLQIKLDEIKGTAELIIAKRRGGPTSMQRLAFLSENVLFKDLAR